MDAGVTRPRLLVLCAGLLTLAVVLLICLNIGARAIGFSASWHALLRNTGSASDLVILYLRLPRVLLAMVVGAALGAAGACMQGLTRNPLADPAVFGVNGGAALALVVLFQYQSAPSGLTAYIVAFLGAGLAVGVVYLLAFLLSRADLPIAMAVMGAIVSALLASLVTLILLATGHDLYAVQFWLAGSLNGRDWPEVFATLPPVAVGLGITFALPGRLNALALGPTVARGLGMSVTVTWIWATVGILALCAAAVAVAGPIGFVGLLVPHALRPFTGSDYRRLLPACAFMGAMYLSLCDLAARSSTVAFHDEIPVGIVCALLGTPMLLVALSRRVASV